MHYHAHLRLLCKCCCVGSFRCVYHVCRLKTIRSLRTNAGISANETLPPYLLPYATIRAYHTSNQRLSYVRTISLTIRYHTLIPYLLLEIIIRSYHISYHTIPYASTIPPTIRYHTSYHTLPYLLPYLLPYATIRSYHTSY